jgi:hypothetical protein
MVSPQIERIRGAGRDSLSLIAFRSVARRAGSHRSNRGVGMRVCTPS